MGKKGENGKKSDASLFDCNQTDTDFGNQSVPILRQGKNVG